MRHAHELTEAGVGDHVPVLAVDRDVPLGVDDRQVGLDLVGLGVAGGMHVEDAGVHHFGTDAQQPVDDGVHVALVARNRMARQHDRVVLAELQPLVLAAGHQTERRHRLTL